MGWPMRRGPTGSLENLDGPQPEVPMAEQTKEASREINLESEAEGIGENNSVGPELSGRELDVSMSVDEPARVLPSDGQHGQSACSCGCVLMMATDERSEHLEEMHRRSREAAQGLAQIRSTLRANGHRCGDQLEDTRAGCRPSAAWMAVPGRPQGWSHPLKQVRHLAGMRSMWTSPELYRQGRLHRGEPFLGSYAGACGDGSAGAQPDLQPSGHERQDLPREGPGDQGACHGHDVGHRESECGCEGQDPGGASPPVNIVDYGNVIHNGLVDGTDPYDISSHRESESYGSFQGQRTRTKPTPIWRTAGSSLAAADGPESSRPMPRSAPNRQRHTLPRKPRLALRLVALKCWKK